MLLARYEDAAAEVDDAREALREGLADVLLRAR